jgi:hypothetical protein
MRQLPKSVIHVNFRVSSTLLFDTRPIWAALRQAEERGRVPASLTQELSQRFGETAEHLAVRHYIMACAIEELKSALSEIYNQVRDPWSLPSVDGCRAVRGEACERARDRVLLAVDSFLFEFRAYLDLLARFVHGVLQALRVGPSPTAVLSSGRTVRIAAKSGKLNPHLFLLYLCDKLQMSTSWYDFLSTNRNFLTHEAAPYCEIEDRMVRPPEFDLIITKKNVSDLRQADPSDFFRVSECQAVVNGIRELSAAAQRYLVDILQR